MSSSAGEIHIKRRRDAVRILHILNAAGEPIRKHEDAPANAVKVVRAEKRLQALDFWVRNPDYLANEILDRYEESGDESLLSLAAKVMEGEEPELRRLGMLRFFFGAFERVQDAVAILKMLGLVDVRIRLKADSLKLDRRDYYVLQQGATKAGELAGDDTLRWYADRAALVAQVAGNRSGAKLKKAQYSVDRYEDTRWGDLIAPIREQVTQRLATLQERARQ